MNWKKFGKIALMVLTVAFVAQAGLRLWWPPAEKANALDAEVWLCLDWNNFEGADCEAVATLADAAEKL